MPDIIGVRFKPVTKIYYFLPLKDEKLQVGDPVIVETSRGKELGWVAIAQKRVSDNEIKGRLKTILGRATPLDLMKMNEYEQKRSAALEKCQAKVAELGLPMKVIDAEYSFDGSRVLISFSAEQRVDFRALVRALVRSLRTRVEMRQIGARDEAKIIDGYGRCGRRLCCSNWLTEFHPVSIRMAKNQQLPLAPTEISGVCGRLLCCLAYEDEMYRDLRKSFPRVGKRIQLEEGEGIVKGLNILKQTIIVEMADTGSRLEVAVPTDKEAATEKDGSPVEAKPLSEPRSPDAKRSRPRQAPSKSTKPPEVAGKQAGGDKRAGAKKTSSRRRSRSRSWTRKKKNQPKKN